MTAKIVIDGSEDTTQYQLVAVRGDKTEVVCQFPVEGSLDDVEVHVTDRGSNGRTATICLNTSKVEVSAPKELVEDTKPKKKRRKRRTKAQIQADKEAAESKKLEEKAEEVLNEDTTAKKADSKTRRNVAAAAVASAKAAAARPEYTEEVDTTEEEESEDDIEDPTAILQDRSTVIDSDETETVATSNGIAAGAVPY